VGETRIPIETTIETCAGTCAAYVIRSLALRAAGMEPAHDLVFREVMSSTHGAKLDDVHAWLSRTLPDLHRLGYRVHGRRVVKSPVWVGDWVQAGKGRRGAVLDVDVSSLRPDDDVSGQGSVALLVSSKGALTVVDPWPPALDPYSPPVSLEPAHRACLYSTLLVYWQGWGDPRE
jgi:hypothetical protein